MAAAIVGRAPLFKGDGRIEFERREYRPPEADELLIAPRANALCGSDRHFWVHGASHVPGHETAGVVVTAGDATTTPAGTRGVIFLMDFCGTCRSCRVGATNQCLAKRADMGIADDGGFGPYEVVHESNFFPITDDVDAAAATMLLDVMGTSRHAIGRALAVRKDIESIYIAGSGPIGIGLLVMAKLLLGADIPVHISDVSAWRLELAESFGGRPVDATNVADIGRADIAFDSTGKTVARRAALDVLAKRGALVCVGHGETVVLDVSGDLIGPERAVLGSEYFTFDLLPRNLELLRDNHDLISRVITHRFPVEEIGEACDLFFSGKTGKVVVEQAGS